MNLPLISVIIPAYNSEKTILKVVQAVLQQTYQNIEIIIVDDGSTDNTAEIIKSIDRAKYVHQKNAGPASARNLGAKNTGGEVLFFTDSDCIADRKWIETALKGFEDLKVGVVSGSYGINNEENILARCIHKEIIFRHKFLMPKYPKVFGSYNFAIRKNIFDEVKGFNGGYRSASGEDNDLSYKVLKAGYIILFERKAIVGHFHPSKLKKYLLEQYRHGFWRVKLYRDHPKMLAGDGYTFWKDILEVPMSWLCFLGIVLSVISWGSFLMYLLYVVLILFLVEIIVASSMVKNLEESFYFAYVTTLRAFFRTSGFTFGIIYFLFKK